MPRSCHLEIVCGLDRHRQPRGITEYQQKLRERYIAATVMPAPEPWQPVLDHRTPIGGLLGISFAVHPDSGHDLVMVVSSVGH